MKKIFILIGVALLLGGCYDYKEINDLAIISAIGIDYKDDEYMVTLEVLNDKQDKGSASVTTYTKNGTGKTLTEAIEDASDKIAKGTNFSHVKLMILSKSLMEEKFENIFDLFLRNIYFRENFYVVGSIKNSPEEILSNTNDFEKNASNAIILMLENMNYSSNSNVLKEFDQVVKDSLNFGLDACFSNVSLKDKNFYVDGLIVFDGYKYKSLFSNEDAKIYNILNNDFDRPTYFIDYNGKSFTIAMNDGKVNVGIKKGKIKVEGSLMGRIIDNDPDFDIRNNDVLDKINNDFRKLINDKIYEFIKKMQNNNSDLLGLSLGYYKDKRIKDENYWKYLDIDVDVKFNLNKKGLIYEK